MSPIGTACLFLSACFFCGFLPSVFVHCNEAGFRCANGERKKLFRIEVCAPEFLLALHGPCETLRLPGGRGVLLSQLIQKAQRSVREAALFTR